MGNARTFGKAYHIAGEEWMTWNRHHQSVAETLYGPTLTPVHIPPDLLVRLGEACELVCVENFQFNNVFHTPAARADLDFR